MTNILISPNKYIQGMGEMKNLGKYALSYGKKALIVTTESGYKRISKTLEHSFTESNISFVTNFFNGECSKNEINKLITIIQNNKCDIVIGIGGGKILDTAKAVAYYASLPIIVCPTIASTDAPCSAISVLYSDNGTFEKYLYLPSNPNLVLVDTDIIAKSPVKLTVAGMGDALSTYFEARAVFAKKATTSAGGTATLAAISLAKLCYETLISEGRKAKSDLESGVCTPAVEKIIETNILLSGIGFESGGLAAAHSINNALSVLEECRNVYHGAKVAFGTIVQLVLENAPTEELQTVINFCIDLGLPVNLKELGVTNITDEKIMKVATAACKPNESIHNMPFEVTPKAVYESIIKVNTNNHYFY